VTLNNPGKSEKSVYEIQDDLLVDIQNNRPLAAGKLQRLPPLRAYLIAEIAAMAGVGLQYGTFEQLRAEVKSVAHTSTLGDWWMRDLLCR
jgi:hypothetical protein